MTLTLDALSASARVALTGRLDGLLAQRVQAFAESTVTGGTGDAADRAGNVEAIIRLEDLDARIAALRDQLDAPAATESASETVRLGSRIGIRFGNDEAAEQYLVGFLEQSGAGIEVVTPASPLGRALLGASAGADVSYRAANGAVLKAMLISVDG